MKRRLSCIPTASIKTGSAYCCPTLCFSNSERPRARQAYIECHPFSTDITSKLLTLMGIGLVFFRHLLSNEGLQLIDFVEVALSKFCEANPNATVNQTTRVQNKSHSGGGMCLTFSSIVSHRQLVVQSFAKQLLCLRTTLR